MSSMAADPIRAGATCGKALASTTASSTSCGNETKAAPGFGPLARAIALDKISEMLFGS